MKMVSQGAWVVDGNTLRFNVEIDGFERGDVSLPAGKLFCAVPVWGDILSKDKGILTIKQRRSFREFQNRCIYECGILYVIRKLCSFQGLSDM